MWHTERMNEKTKSKKDTKQGRKKESKYERTKKEIFLNHCQKSKPNVSK